MKKKNSEVEDIGEVAPLDCQELSTALRHFADAAERLNVALSNDGIEKGKREDHDKAVMEQWVTMNTTQLQENE
jgi:hypothetical protein